LKTTAGSWLGKEEATDNTSIHPSWGVFTVAGKLSDDLAPGTLNSILKQAGLKEKQ
jgi:hypothetical protein